MMKRTAASLSAVAFFLSAWAGPAGAQEKFKIKWLIGHPSTDYFEDAARYFKTTVERESRHEIVVQIKADENQWEDLGKGTPGPEIARAVARGEAQMGHSFTDIMGGLDPRMHAFDLPFLFRDYEHQEQVFEGPIGRELLDGLGDHGIKGMAFTYSGGANVISTRGRELRTPADLQGLRIAVFGNEVDRTWLSSLGAVPVSIHHREDSVRELLARDQIDAALLTWRRHYRALRGSQSAKEVLEFGNLEGASYLVSVTYMNQDFFESLPAKYRTLVMDTARVAARIERERTIELNERSKRRLLSKGVREVTARAADRQEFHKALAPAYEKSLNAIVGKDLVERIRRTDGRLAYRAGLNPR